MATWDKFEAFTQAVAEKKHDLSNDQFRLAFTPTAPDLAADAVLADVAGVVSSANIDSTAVTQSGSLVSGQYRCAITDKTLTATGTVPTWRYIILYNDTASNDELIASFDYGSDVDMENGETFDLDFADPTFTIGA